MKARSAAIDALRVAGILAVVAGHVWSSDSARGLLYTWHVPLFFVLSGYLWTRDRSMLVEAKGRWRSIGQPYVAWLVIIAIPSLALLSTSGENVLERAGRLVLGGAFIGRPFSAFWFMTALVIACLAFRWLERFPPIVTWIMAAVGMAACAIAPGLVSKAPLSGGVAIAALAFLIAGQALRDFRDRIRHPVILALAMLVVSGILIATRVSRPLDMKQADLGTPVLSAAVAIAICFALILLSEAVFAQRRGFIPMLVVELAAVGTTVVLTHTVVLFVMETPPDGTWLDFLLAATIPWALALVIIRTPLARFLVGVPQRGVRQEGLEAPPHPRERSAPAAAPDVS